MDLTLLYGILYVVAILLALAAAFNVPSKVQLGWLAIAVWISVPLIRLLVG